MDLSNDDVADILALLDSLPYDELDLQTPRFRLTLRRTPDGWTQRTQVLSAPDEAAAPTRRATTPMPHRRGQDPMPLRARRKITRSFLECGMLVWYGQHGGNQ